MIHLKRLVTGYLPIIFIAGLVVLCSRYEIVRDFLFWTVMFMIVSGMAYAIGSAIYPPLGDNDR